MILARHSVSEAGQQCCSLIATAIGDKGVGPRSSVGDKSA